MIIERGVSSSTEQSKRYHAVCIGADVSEKEKKDHHILETGIEKSFWIFLSYVRIK
jgi:hypothetical protein